MILIRPRTSSPLKRILPSPEHLLVSFANVSTFAAGKWLSVSGNFQIYSDSEGYVRICNKIHTIFSLPKLLVLAAHGVFILKDVSWTLSQIPYYRTSHRHKLVNMAYGRFWNTIDWQNQKSALLPRSSDTESFLNAVIFWKVRAGPQFWNMYKNQKTPQTCPTQFLMLYKNGVFMFFAIKSYCQLNVVAPSSGKVSTLLGNWENPFTYLLPFKIRNL